MNENDYLAKGALLAAILMTILLSLFHYSGGTFDSSPTLEQRIEQLEIQDSVLFENYKALMDEQAE